MREEIEHRSPQHKLCGYEYTVKRGDSFYLIAQRLGVPLRDLLDANSDINPARLMVGDVLCIPMEEDDAVTTPAQEPAGQETGSAVPLASIGEKTEPAAPEPMSAAIETEKQTAGMMAAGSVTQVVLEAMPAIPDAATETMLQTQAAVMAETDALVITAAESSESSAAAQQNEAEKKDACHTVMAGETAADILQAADISLKTLAAANPGVDLDNLSVGDQVCVPAESVPCGNARFYRVEDGGNLETLALLLDVSVASLLRANPCLAPRDFKEGAVISLP